MFFCCSTEKKGTCTAAPSKTLDYWPKKHKKEHKFKKSFNLLDLHSKTTQIYFIYCKNKTKQNVSEFLCKFYLVAIYSKSLPIWWQKVSLKKKKYPPPKKKKIFINLSCQKCTFKLLSILDSTLIHPLDVTSGKVNSMLSHSGEQPPHHQR